MSWRALAEAATLIEGFNPSEQAALTAAAGAVDGMTTILTSAILEARGIVQAAGAATLPTDATALPDSLRPHVIALARWRWLVAFPALKSLQTDVRKEAAEKAEEILGLVATGKRPVEADAAADAVTPVSGNSGTEVKIAMRTSQL